MKSTLFRTACRGNALMEYVVPAAILILAVGVLNTIFDINDIITDYFLAASGHVRADLQGTMLVTDPMGSGVVGAHETGADGFAGVPFATVTGGAIAIPAGNPIEEKRGIYTGALSRTGRVNVATATGNERLYLFDNERGGAMRPEPPPPVAAAI